MTRLLALSSCLVLLLAACVPTTQRTASDPAETVIIVNGPAENSVAGLADELSNRLQAEPGCCAFEIHWAAPVRAQERQRDLNGYRAWGSAARIARNLGAGWAVLVGVNDFDRTVTERGDRLEVTVATGLIVHVLDSEANEVASYESATRHARRYQPKEAPLVGERQEPLREDLALQALGDIIAPLIGELDWVTGNAPLQRK